MSCFHSRKSSTTIRHRPRLSTLSSPRTREIFRSSIFDFFIFRFFDFSRFGVFFFKRFFSILSDFFNFSIFSFSVLPDFLICLNFEFSFFSIKFCFFRFLIFHVGSHFQVWFLSSRTVDMVYPIPTWEERVTRLYPYWQLAEKVVVGFAGVLMAVSAGIMVFVVVLSNKHRGSFLELVIAKKKQKKKKKSRNNLERSKLGFLGFELIFSCVKTFSDIFLFSTKVIKAASPPFLLLFLFGSILLYLGIILWSLYVPSAVCNAVAWCLSIGFVIMFSSLFGRTFRILQIIKKSKYAPVKFTNKKLLGFVSILVAIDVIILAIWSGAFPIRGELFTPDPYRPLQNVMQCT